MLPKLKGDTLFIPTSDGVYFRNNENSFKIKGKMVYRWVKSLAPYLNGEYTLAQITAGLNAEKHAMVTELVNTLLGQGFLKDLSRDLPHHLSQTERATYAAEIEFIDSFCDSAATRFERFREQQVLLIGSGLTLTGLVKALLKGGLRQVAVIVTPECETNTRRHVACGFIPQVDLFHKGDPRQTLREIDAPAWENEAEVLATLQPFDTIIHVSDRPMLARASMLNRLCVTHKKNLLQAMIVDDHAWLGPLVRGQEPDRGRIGASRTGTSPVPTGEGCWECAWRRLQGNLTDMQTQFPLYAFQDQTTIPISRFVALPTAAFVANHLGFEIFKSLTEAGPVETAGNLIEVNLETLRTQKHPFMPHPLCRTCQHPEPRTEAQFLDTIRQLEQGETAQATDQPSDQDEDLFSRQIVPCFEKCLGLFSLLDEGDLIQLPLSVCKAVVSNPMPWERATNPPAVLGSGFAFGIARRRGAQRACEIYAASLADQRRFPSLQEGGDMPERIPAERFLSPGAAQGTLPKGSAPSAPMDWTWATDLSTGQACLVPAPLVYPILSGLSPLGETELGISSARSWAEAVVQALLKICRYLTITQREHTQYPQINLSTVTLSPEGERLRRLLERMDDSITVYDVTGPLQVPTFAICLGDQTVAYGIHVDASQALQDGLEQAVLSKQLSGQQILVENLPFLPDLPLSLRGTGSAQDKISFSMHDALPGWPDLKNWLQEVLLMNGWRTFAVPLDHDPVLRAIQPYIVHVLVARA